MFTNDHFKGFLTTVSYIKFIWLMNGLFELDVKTKL
jgi:hypothetical protein